LKTLTIKSIAVFVELVLSPDQSGRILFEENRRTAAGRYDTTKQYVRKNSSHTVYTAEIRLT